MRDLRYGGTTADKRELDAILKSVRKSIKTGNWQTGEQARLMEKEAAKQLGVKYGILTTSGSSAGLLALSALELPRGSEVIIPAVTFPTIFNIITQCGLTPVVVDCSVGTYNIDVSRLEEAISTQTRAIIVVHAVGNPADMPAIMRIAKKHKLYVIEDNCDGWGGAISGKKIGSFGDISFTSFHAAHIVSMGVGGAVFTNNATLASRVRVYRDWGRQAEVKEKQNGRRWPNFPEEYDSRFIYEKIGYNFQVLELQAAMGRVQLRRANKIKKARQHNANHLVNGLFDLPLTLPSVLPSADVCWFALPITCHGDRGKLVPFLEKHGIETRSMFAGNIIRHPAYKDTNYRVGNVLGGADTILENSFWITVHPRLKKSDLDYIISVFKKFYAQPS